MYLDETWTNIKNDCRIMIYDHDVGNSVVVIRIIAKRYNKLHEAIKSFSDILMIRLSEIHDLQKIRNVNENGVDPMLSGIFNQKIDRQGTTKSIAYHLSDNNLYVRKGLTKFAIIPDAMYMFKVKCAIHKYYENRKHIIGVRDQAPPRCP